LVDNQVGLQLFAPADNLGNFLRRLALPRSVKHWPLTTLRDKLVKIGAKVVDPCAVRDLPDGGSGRAEEAVQGNPGSHSTAAPA